MKTKYAPDNGLFPRNSWRNDLKDYLHDLGNRINVVNAKAFLEGHDIDEEWIGHMKIYNLAVQVLNDKAFPGGKGDELTRHVADLLDLLDANAELDKAQGRLV